MDNFYRRLRTLKRACGYGILSGLALLILWFPVTWFFFGSVHPCGILTQRMTNRLSAYATVEWGIEFFRSHNIFFQTGEESPPVEDLDRRLEQGIASSRRSAYRLPPATCLWRAITWRWDKGKDPYYQGLQDEERRERELGKQLDQELLHRIERQRK